MSKPNRKTTRSVGAISPNKGIDLMPSLKYPEQFQPDSLDAETEANIMRVVFSQTSWLWEKLQNLHEDTHNDGWRVLRLKELADYCRRSPEPMQQVKAFSDFLAPGFSAEVHCAAAECIRMLLPPAPGPSVDVEATVMWIEGDLVTARFPHPSLGIVEREFEREALPSGAEAGDSFSLRVESNTAGRVVGYQPIRNGGLEKRVPTEWERITMPPAPEDLDDQEEMARYDAAMDQYMVQTTALRARDAARWKATGKP